jgi:hypothetical protein
MVTFIKIFGALVGLAILFGAAWMWRNWEIDGLIAVIIGFAGLALIFGVLDPDKLKG